MTDQERASDLWTQLRTCCADKSHEEKEAMITDALTSVREEVISKLEKLDPLEATGDFWEYGQTDDVAHGVHKWLVEQLRTQERK